MRTPFLSKASLRRPAARFCSALLNIWPLPFTPLCSIRSQPITTHNGGCGEMAQRAFQLRLDPLTGNAEWVIVEAGEEEEQRLTQSNTQALLAATSYLDMLNDSYRNHAFHQAIKKAVTGPCHVLDIGAGTGLLSMMALRAMQESGAGGSTDGRVTACESYLPMGKLMRKILRANRMDKNISLLHKRSDEVEVGVDVDSRADILVCEILDSEFLGEGLIPTLQHAHDFLLVPNPQTVPHRGSFYGQLVESSFLRSFHDLHGCDLQNQDGLCLAPFDMKCDTCVKPKQYAMHCDAMAKEIKLLSEPFKVFEFDFSSRPKSTGKSALQVKTINNGTVHAIISWWVLQLDNDGLIIYSTAPTWVSLSNVPTAVSTKGKKEWCDHWKQCVWFVPGSGISVSDDRVFLLHATHDATSITYHLKNNGQTDTMDRLVDTSGYSQECQLSLSPERAGIYGDKDWRSKQLSAIRHLLQEKDPKLCLIVDDSMPLTVMASQVYKTASIVSMFPGLREKASSYLSAIADANGISKGQVKILGKRASNVTADDLYQRKVDLLIGEPFYCGNEGVLPWQNLRFWNERTLLDAFLSEEVVVMPCKGILKACAMSLPDLWRSRCSLKSLEGFDHSPANEILGACGEMPPGFEGPSLPYFIWQCGQTKELSNAFTIMEFDFSMPIQHCFGQTKITFTSSGLCHGFALWIDWVIDECNSIIISTGPVSRFWKQGVKLLNKPILVNTSASCEVGGFISSELEAAFNPSTGQLSVKYQFFCS